MQTSLLDQLLGMDQHLATVTDAVKKWLRNVLALILKCLNHGVDHGANRHLNVLLLIKSRLDPSQETDEIATMRRGFWHGVQRPLDVVDEEARVLDLVPSFLIA